MNELERAVTTLLDRPPAPPAPLEMIERRAGTLRRRRRLLEAGGIALVLLLLGTAGLALSAARSDDGQGVFVGQGPSTPAASAVATYQLASPVDGATAEALEQAIEARFRWAWAGDADVKVEGLEVTVSASAPIRADRFDALVTSIGGFQLHVVGAEAPEAQCRSAGGGYGSPQALWTSALAGPPRCLFVEPSIVLPFPPATESGISASPTGGYQTDLILTTAASRSYLDATTTCSAGSDAACGRSTIGVATGGALLHPEASVTVEPLFGAEIVKLAVPGFTEDADAELWAAVLVHPLPESVLLTRAPVGSGETPETTAAAPQAPSASVTIIDGEFPPPPAAGSTVFVFDGPRLEGDALAQVVSVLDARFQAIGLDTGDGVWVESSASGTRLGFRVGAVPTLDPSVVAAVFAIQPQFVVMGAYTLHLGASQILGAVVDAADPTLVQVRVAAGLLSTNQSLACNDTGQCTLPDVSFPITGPAQAQVVDAIDDTITLRFPDAPTAQIYGAMLEHPFAGEISLTGSAS